MPAGKNIIPHWPRRHVRYPHELSSPGHSSGVVHSMLPPLPPLPPMPPSPPRPPMPPIAPPAPPIPPPASPMPPPVELVVVVDPCAGPGVVARSQPALLTASKPKMAVVTVCPANFVITSAPQRFD